MMAGRSDERICVVDGAVEYRVDGGDRATRGEQGDLERAVAERRLATGLPAAALRQARDAVDVRAVVHTADLLDRRRPRWQVTRRCGEPGRVEKVLEPPLRVRALCVRHAARASRPRGARTRRIPCRATCTSRARRVPCALSASTPRRSAASSGRSRSRARSRRPRGRCPEMPTPPKGAVRSRTRNVFTHTVPGADRAADPVRTLPPSPCRRSPRARTASSLRARRPPPRSRTSGA